MDVTDHAFGTDRITVRVAAAGAELHSLRDAAGREHVWPGLPAWPRHAPVLFPIVGRLADDTAWIDGKPYHLTQHGFARDRMFNWVERTGAGCTLVLTDDEDSRHIFPFRFSLTITYRVDGNVLHVGYTLHNPDDHVVLHASLGTHPAFAWPLRPDVAKEDHILEFAHPEPAPVRRLAKGLLLPDLFPSPIEGRELPLSEDLFAADALILDHPASRQVTFRTPDGQGLTMAWHGFRQLGLWMKPGTDFLCIEPWYGFASPVGFSGDFVTKPGLLHIAPGQSWTAAWSVRLEPGLNP
ncbi:aldose 1-epimerase family protein [Gluconacetobacter azotocaptans]|uniref:aldose 1-epimerase family protein n=1 Tax=Gluconacetobacter azotocaptans TaxID=142834 RepID=UPI00195C2824|nr:aldose 1-epimerase family protein [Gluconacetobacter azotocaptans]MBM9401245.1 aldose 1-epimerase family protein [Gluconacetobacter azotocaptans]